MSYRQIAIICEGQTEQGFTEQILGPYLAQRCYERNITLDVRPIIVHTGVLASGAKAKGGGDWPKWKDRIWKTLGGTHWTVVTMMMDYYGCPKNIPGLTVKHSATEVEQLIRAEFSDQRLLPNVIQYEFETLIWAALRQYPKGQGFDCFIQEAENLAQRYEPEEINSNPETAPSKRLAAVTGDGAKPYRKIVDSQRILGTVDFDDVVELCPRFKSWTDRLVEVCCA